MLEMHRISDLLNIVLERMKNFYRREGYCFPSLLLLNNGSPIYLPDYQKEIIVSIETDDNPRFNIYKTIISLRISNDKDEAAVQVIANEIAERYKPDAIAFIMQCLYKPKTKIDEIPNSLQTDPEIIRILHSCAYNSTGKGIMKIIPYINKGEIKIGNENKYDVLFCESPWEIENSELKPCISNPFK